MFMCIYPTGVTCACALQAFVITSAMFRERCVTAARKIQDHRYSAEAEENVKFKTFVQNYQAANQGKNTQRHQLTFARKKKRVPKTQGNYSACILCSMFYLLG